MTGYMCRLDGEDVERKKGYVFLIGISSHANDGDLSCRRQEHAAEEYRHALDGEKGTDSASHSGS